MTNDMFATNDMNTMEYLIDRYGLNAVLDNMADIASEKADHVFINYNDTVTADTWDRAASNLRVAASSVFASTLRAHIK